MPSTTPNPQSSAARASAGGQRSHSRTGSRPTTPLRRPHTATSAAQSLSSTTAAATFPLDTLEPQFAELAEAMGTLEANLGELHVMHDSISRFNENFSAFLFGLNMNAFCIDFPEAPVTADSFRRVADREASVHGASPFYTHIDGWMGWAKMVAATGGMGGGVGGTMGGTMGGAMGGGAYARSDFGDGEATFMCVGPLHMHIVLGLMTGQDNRHVVCGGPCGQHGRLGFACAAQARAIDQRRRWQSPARKWASAGPGGRGGSISRMIDYTHTLEQ